MKEYSIEQLYIQCGIAHAIITTDTRTIMPGSVFVALVGDTFDGNDFIDTALEMGASWVISHRTSQDPRVITVPDTLQTLSELARYHRERFDIPVIAIAGSNGKTTTKELTRSVLEQGYSVWYTKGNYNNHIGVPLTLLQLRSSHTVAVIEVGANHAGEHTELLRIVQPTHVLVTNNGMDYLEGFGSPEGVRAANAEVYEYAREKSAIAFVDTAMNDLMQDSHGLARVEYGNYTSVPGEFAGAVDGDVVYQSQLAGSFNEINIVAAVTIGEYFGIESEKIQQAIAEYQPTLNRSQVKMVGNSCWVVDCYNANPTSMIASFESFMKVYRAPRLVILGDMREMGAYEARVHDEVVARVITSAPERMIFVGKAMLSAKEQLDTVPDNSLWFLDVEAAKDYLSQNPSLLENCTILIKGSNGVGLKALVP